LACRSAAERRSLIVLSAVNAAEPPRDTALAASFGAAASRYGAHARVQIDLAAWLAEWLPPAGAGRMLEVGAGPGVFTRHLSSWKGEVLATDVSQRMCEEGQRRLPRVAWSLMRADAPHPGPWDWIVSSSALQWARDPDALFRAWRLAAGARGRLLVGFFVADTLPEWAATTDVPGPVAWRSADAWRASLRRNGWRVHRSESCVRLYGYPSATRFLRSLHAVGAAPDRKLSPAHLRRALASYTVAFPHPAGGVRATWTFFRCEAEVDTR